MPNRSLTSEKAIREKFDQPLIAKRKGILCCSGALWYSDSPSIVLLFIQDPLMQHDSLTGHPVILKNTLPQNFNHTRLGCLFLRISRTENGSSYVKPEGSLWREWFKTFGMPLLPGHEMWRNSGSWVKQNSNSKPEAAAKPRCNRPGGLWACAELWEWKSIYH